MTGYPIAQSRRRFLFIAASSAAAAALAGCSAGVPAPISGTREKAPTTPSTGEPTVPQHLKSAALRTAPGDPGLARQALAGFGADFLRLTQADSSNTVISPYSLYTVLAMARAGAKNTTAAQLNAVLRLDGSAQGSAITAIDNGISNATDAARQMQSKIIVEAANETWVQNGVDVQQDYLDQLARQFGVSAVAADFLNDPEGMRKAINSWVAERTNALIPELFAQGSINEDSMVVLVNALYLKASWARPFYPGTPAPFTLLDGTSVPSPMMSAPGHVAGASGDGWSAATISYSGNALAMTLLVPDAGNFSAVVAALDADVIRAASVPTGQFELTMPPFKVTSAPDAKRAVQQLGVVDVFIDGVADLSGIAGDPGWLFAGSFVHQATISVDENGTEAAAATGMGMMASGAPTPAPELVIDRPFLFWISETSTGSPLFLGTVVNPVA
jgi:serpin B